MSKLLKSRRRQDYPFFESQRTRWNDNDQYGHVNNAVYYHYFESAIASYVVQCGGDPKSLGLALSSSCQFFAPVSFPQVLELGLRVTKLEKRSVTFEIAVFAEGENAPAAVGVMAYLETEEIDVKLREGLSNLYPEKPKL